MHSRRDHHCYSAVLILSLLVPWLLQGQSRRSQDGAEIIMPVPSEANHQDIEGAERNALRSSHPKRVDAIQGGVFSVTNEADTGAGSFRRAIEDANNLPGKDIIRFDISGAGVKVISLKSTLPLIDDPVIIDGTTQAGYSGSPLIQIDGLNAGVTNGLDIAGGNSEVKALAITRFSGDGIQLGIQGYNTIEGCYVGIAPDGITNRGNARYGIRVVCGNNQIGNRAARGNVISGNGNDGIEIMGPNASDNSIRNCLIGTSASGLAAVPNAGFGIYIAKSSDDTIGGRSYEGNIISGNTKAGISLRGVLTSRIIILSNYIGSTAASLLTLGNDNGIEITQETPINQIPIEGTPSFITIGSPVPLTGNIISGNRGAGIAIFQDTLLGVGIKIYGNTIGLNFAGTDTIPNRLGGIFIRKHEVGGQNTGITIGGMSSDSGNVISGNHQYGIWVIGSGARQNSIRGNLIGVHSQSTRLFLGNGLDGIFLDSAGYNVIGGEEIAAGNFIGRNLGSGISIVGPNNRGNVVYNNGVGAKDINAGVWAGNAIYGVYIDASGTIVGGPGKENVIAGNGSAAIFVNSGLGNTLRYNRTYLNAGLGIDLAPLGVTRNDTLDPDNGPNELINFPVLDSGLVTTTGIHLKGHLLGKPGTQYFVDFYKNNTRNPSKFGEGDTLVHTENITTTFGEMTPFTVDIVGAYTDDDFITATASDADGNTSEFSRALCLKDADGDGILDCWEMQGDGIDVNADGVIDLDLYAKGAKPDHKDIFVEVDAMFANRPKANALAMVTDAFDRVPNALIGNPDGLGGVHLVLEYASADQPIDLHEWTGDKATVWAQFFADKADARWGFGTQAERTSSNSANILAAKRLVYRYCIFGEKIPDIIATSHVWGRSENDKGKGGNDFMLGLGAYTPSGGTDSVQAGIFMHELGHSLGLSHGGGDHSGFKPNYVSVMNYLWTVPEKKYGVFGEMSWNLDYSRVKLPSLDESRLHEAVGVNPPAGEYPFILFPFITGDGSVRTGWIVHGKAVDWDGNGDSSGYATRTVNINDLSTEFSSPAGEVLQGYKDWPNLKYNFRNSNDYPQNPPMVLAAGLAPPDSEPQEIGPYIDSILQSLPPYGIVRHSRIPTLTPGEITVVGGAEILLRADLDTPAPIGGQTYSIVNSDTTIVSAPTSLTIPEGGSYGEITLQTFGVAADQIVRVTFFGGETPTSALITIQPANLVSSAALTDSGCTVGDIDGFRKKFLAGVPILFGITLDGQAPPAGASMKIASSRPDIFPLPSSSLQFAPFSRDTMLVLTSSENVTSPQRVVITSQYRSRIVFDTITILQKPQYSYTILPAQFQSAEVYDFNNRGEILFRGNDSLNFIWHDGVETAVPANLTKMNDSGWVAGYRLGDDFYKSQAAIFKNGTTFIIPNPNSEFTRSFGKAINNLRHVALYSERATFPYGPSKFTIWENGAMTDPGSIGEYWLDPTDINDNGIVVGTGYQSGNFNIPYRIPFVWDGDTLSRVPIPPDWNGEGIAVNKSGVIVGNIPPWGFLFEQGVLSMILFPPPFGRGQVFDMNDSGVVVGSMQKYLGELWGEPSAFVFRDGLLYDLNCVASLPSGLKLTSATKINNAGDIIGEVRDGKTFLQSYLLRQGNVTDVRTDMPVKEIPTQYLLAQNYPNPFNPTTIIRYDIPRASRVTLKLFNVLGQEVATLVKEEKVAGSYEAQWNADRFSSGVYFYRLTAGSFTSVKKMLLLK